MLKNLKNYMLYISIFQYTRKDYRLERLVGGVTGRPETMCPSTNVLGPLSLHSANMKKVFSMCLWWSDGTSQNDVPNFRGPLDPKLFILEHTLSLK